MVGVAALFGNSCGPIPDYRTLVEVDLHPPQFLGAVAVDPRTVLLRFDEKVIERPATTTIVPETAISSVAADGELLTVCLGSDQAIGTEYAVEVSVEDECRNSTTVLTKFYGFNPDLPRVLINEFITQGSTTHPDLVELWVAERGNTAGMCLYEGVQQNWDDRLILPPIAVEPGDYLLVHFKPQGLPEEVDETERTDISGGLDSSLNAFDLWVRQGGGLSGNNGVLSLYSCPGGRILDAVVYSNRTSESDTNYAGFGSADVYARVCALEAAGAWTFTGEHIAPEDAVNPDPSTATRSIARDSRSGDTDGRSDWHITPTSGSTFGELNGDAVYVP